MQGEQHDPGSPSAWLGEGALAQSSERYASMFTYHPHAAYSVDRHGFFTDANPRALDMTGLSLEQIRESHFAQVIHPEDLHLIQRAFDGAMAGLPQLVEARVVRADGVILDVRCTGIPVVVGGEVVGVHGITEDVTAAKQVVRELEEANAAKALFLATIGHEVRTPLAALVGATDLLMHTELEPEPAHYAHLVQRSAQRLVHLVNDILEFSGLEARSIELHPRPFEVLAVVEEVAEWAVPQAESRGLSISFDVDESVPATLAGDARRVAQVLAGLVQNALAFTERGTVDVRVSARDATPDPDGTASGDAWVEFTVSDTGIGIAEEHQHRLFEPFIQVGSRGARDHRGVGLGLAICRELVDLMGGRLTVCSTLGEGSTFSFGLALERCPEDSLRR